MAIETPLITASRMGHNSKPAPTKQVKVGDQWLDVYILFGEEWVSLMCIQNVPLSSLVACGCEVRAKAAQVSPQGSEPQQGSANLGPA